MLTTLLSNSFKNRKIFSLGSSLTPAPAATTAVSPVAIMAALVATTVVSPVRIPSPALSLGPSPSPVLTPSLLSPLSRLSRRLR